MNSISKTIKLSPDLIYFQGHFPDFPVLPAVAFIKLSQSLIEEQVSQKFIFLKANGWRFRQPLQPQQEILFEAISVETHPQSKKTTFRVRWSKIHPEVSQITEGQLELQNF